MALSSRAQRITFASRRGGTHALAQLKRGAVEAEDDGVRKEPPHLLDGPFVVLGVTDDIDPALGQDAAHPKPGHRLQVGE